jgi:hypothetical protein
MDILAALSRAADVTKPGVRDQLPVASVVFTIAALLVAGAPERVPTVHKLVSSVERLGAIGLTVLILGLIATSILLQPLLTSLDQVLYGYRTTRWIQRLTRRSSLRHRERMRANMEALEEARYELNHGVRAILYERGDPPSEEGKAVTQQRIRLFLASQAGEPFQELQDRITRFEAAGRRYPSSPEKVRATMLGNILAAAEESAGERYDLNTLLVFPRLEVLLSDSMTRRVVGRRDDLRFAVRLASALIIASISSTLIFLLTIPQMSWQDLVWFGVPVAAALLAWASYRNALSAAVQYGEALAVVFDLHRFELYKALHLPVPPNSERERELAKQTNYVLWAGTAYEPIEYQHPGRRHRQK